MINNNFNRPILRRQKENLSIAVIVLISLVILTGFVSAQPIHKASAQQSGCTLSQVQPADSIDMNTVAFKTFAKTVHVEKEIYTNCSGIVPTVLDVSIFTELRENLTSFPKVDPQVSFEVVTCSKIISSGSPIGCKQGIPITNPMPNATGCKQNNIAFPIEMNSINSDKGIIKTVEAEKESFTCKVVGNVPSGFGSLGIKDVIIFTEIFDDIGTGKIVKMSQSATCMKPVGPAPISSKTIICQASKASVIPF